eukprot:1184234-Prorocentrum_minimum.AAC.3
MSRSWIQTLQMPCASALSRQSSEVLPLWEHPAVVESQPPCSRGSFGKDPVHKQTICRRFRTHITYVVQTRASAAMRTIPPNITSGKVSMPSYAYTCQVLFSNENTLFQRI